MLPWLTEEAPNLVLRYTTPLPSLLLITRDNYQTYLVEALVLRVYYRELT